MCMEDDFFVFAMKKKKTLKKKKKTLKWKQRDVLCLKGRLVFFFKGRKSKVYIYIPKRNLGFSSQ